MPLTRRVLDARDIEYVYEFFAAQAVGLFNENHDIAPQLFLVYLEDLPEPLIAALGAIDPGTVAKLHQSSDSKEVLGALIRELLVRGMPPSATPRLPEGMPAVPDLVVHISEAWMATGGDIDTPPSQRADRREAVMVTVHMPDRSFLGLCPIDTKTRHCELGKLDMQLEVAGKLAVHDEPRRPH